MSPDALIHGHLGLIPGVLRCRSCDTNLWPPINYYCHGCGRTLDLQASKPAAEAYNEALKECDERVARATEEYKKKRTTDER